MTHDSSPAVAPDPQAWVGREQVLQASIDLAPVQGLAATLDWPQAPAPGEALPAGWQWLYFNPTARTLDLGEDGHPRRTPDSFLPPVDLPRRMWAGSRIQYLAPLAVGAAATRTSRVLRVTPKEGRSGRMCFVTVVHHTQDGNSTSCIVEEQNIVYREGSAPRAVQAPLPQGDPAPVPGTWTQVVRPDPVLLFRYSALTFNGHRIHYDLPYAQGVEGYAGLVVQGPLTATLLQGFAASLQPAGRLAAFEFKGVAPLFAHEPFALCADEDGAGGLVLRAVTHDGRTVMDAAARFASGG